MKIKIYQINMGRDENRIAFLSMDELEHSTDPSEDIDSSIYDNVFDGEVDCNDLEDVYQKFNLDHPYGYKGRSLSVSDIVEVKEADGVAPGFYYCDNIGFCKVNFDSEKTQPLKETDKIRVLMLEPGKKAYETEVGTSLEEMYAALDCETIEASYPYEDLVAIVCDEEHKINGAKPNRAIYDENGQMVDIICGKFFVCDCSTERFGSLPDDMMQKYKEQFLLPERFARINGTLVAVKFDPAREEER